MSDGALVAIPAEDPDDAAATTTAIAPAAKTAPIQVASRACTGTSSGGGHGSPAQQRRENLCGLPPRAARQRATMAAIATSVPAIAVYTVSSPNIHEM